MITRKIIFVLVCLINKVPRSSLQEKFPRINNKISKNKTELLTENLNNSYENIESYNTQEIIFRQYADTVNKHLSPGNDDKFKFN